MDPLIGFFSNFFQTKEEQNLCRLSTLPPFHHESLISPGTVRLLRLHTGRDADLIECSLEVVSLTTDIEKYPYSALSYVWGDPELKHEIICNGQVMRITRNLFSALKRIRGFSNDTVLWIDAICIDQSTEVAALEERGEQVQMMGTIYSSADKVYVDLGEADEDTISLFQGLSCFDGLTPHFWANAVLHSPQVLAQVRVPPQSFWIKLLRFLNRPWFERVWTLQEYVLAKRAVFLVGAKFLPGKFLHHHLLSACELYYHKAFINFHTFHTGDLEAAEFISQMITGVQKVRWKVNLNTDCQTSSTQYFDLASLLHMTYWLKASNDQDKVYSILSLTAPKCNFPVVYTESSSDTAIRVSLLLLEQSPLYLLYRCVGVDYPQASWSLTLKYKIIDKLQTIWEPTGLNTWFSACGNSKLHILLNRSNLSLKMRGAMIGRIADTSVVYQAYNGGVTTKDTISSFDVSVSRIDVSKWIEKQCLSSAKNFGKSNDFWQTLVADMVEIAGLPFRSSKVAHQLESLKAFLRFFEIKDQSERTPEEEKEALDIANSVSAYISGLGFAIGRRLAVLESRAPCLVPGATRAGDMVFVPTGSPLPMVLRPEGDNFRIVGCCYVRGIMDGELFANANGPPDISQVIIH